ncbi:hypothetical protein ACTMTI_06805 [Nonomuraea sp. H19]|uniref:hypothetical protein n=1 Tax=Nonomuraea sp. H19 TaxID=3452206 RepID=UPI003F8A92D0
MAASLPAALAGRAGQDRSPAAAQLCPTAGPVSRRHAWHAPVPSAGDMTSLVITGSPLAIISLALFMFSPQKHWRSGIPMEAIR